MSSYVGLIFFRNKNLVNLVVFTIIRLQLKMHAKKDFEF